MKIVKLIPYSEEYSKNMQSWLKSSALMKLMDMGPFTDEEINDWPTKDKEVLIVADKISSEIIGFVNFYSFRDDKSCKWGILIDPKYQGKGYGQSATVESLKYAKDRLKMKRINVYIKEDNLVSKNNIEKAGLTFNYFNKTKRRLYFYKDL